MRRTVLLACAVFLLAGVPAGAVSLGECLQRASRNAPSLAAAAAGETRAARAVEEAQSALRPTLKLGASYTENNESPKTVIDLPGVSQSTVIETGSINAVVGRLDAQYTLYSGGRTQAMVRAAEATRASQTELRRAAGADLRLRVALAFYRELAAKRLQAAAAEALETARDHLHLAHTRVDAGAAPRLDELRAQVDLQDRETALLRAAEARRLARVDLESAIGASLAPDDTLDEPQDASAADVDSARTYAAALSHRPDLASLDRQIDGANARAEAARGMRRPTVNLSGNAQYIGPNLHGDYLDFKNAGLHTYNMAATLGVSLPILDGGLAKSQEAQWDAQRVGLESQRRDVLLGIQREIAGGLSGVRLAQQVWQASITRVSTAREALRLASVAYREGAGTNTEVSDAETALVSALAEAAQSLMDFWGAHAQLDHAAGTGLTE